MNVTEKKEQGKPVTVGDHIITPVVRITIVHYGDKNKHDWFHASIQPDAIQVQSATGTQTFEIQKSEVEP